MKGSLLLLIVALFISSVYGNDCNFHISTTAELDAVIANQNWAAPTTKIICFAPGNYSYSDGPAYTITAPQVWRGARVSGDPTCKQHVYPPCSRLQSAKSFNESVESVFLVSNATSNPLFIMSSGTFNFSGFSVNFQTTTNTNFASADTLYMYNNYIMTQGTISVNEIDAYHNYFESAFSTNPTISASLTSGTVQYNYFTECSTALNGSVNDIEHNSFINNIVGIANPSSPSISSNLFVFNPTAFFSNGVASSLDSNAFILSATALSISATGYNMDLTNNCFLGDNDISVINGFFSTQSGSGNYYGSNILQLGGWLPAPHNYGTPSLHPPSLTPPLVCPNNIFSVSVPNPNILSVGDSISISWAFKTGGLIRSGVDFSSLNQETVHFYIYLTNSAIGTHKTLTVTDTIIFNSLGVANNTISFTPTTTDFPTSLNHFTANKFYLVAKVFANFDVGGTPYSHTFNATIPTTFWFRIPLECRTRDSTVIVNKAQRFNGPINLSLADMFCDTNAWSITGINQQPLASPPLSVNGDLRSVNFTIDPTQSGLFNFVVNIASVSNHAIVYKIITHVNVVNHNPIVIPYRQFNFTQWSDVGNVNLLANSSDPDSDTFAVTSIYARGGRNATNIDVLSVYFHFAHDSFVVVADPSGDLSIYSVDLTNPSNPAVGNVIGDLSKFKSSFGLNFVVDDGDRVNHLADGAVVFNHVHSPS